MKADCIVVKEAEKMEIALSIGFYTYKVVVTDHGTFKQVTFSSFPSFIYPSFYFILSFLHFSSF
jgi:hypothetical protein